jgi:mannose-6-phosphate isomerase-like protein (cupin superfamily)
VFRPLARAERGEVDVTTLFHYRQAGRTVWATYDGGRILRGTMVGRFDPDGTLALRYQHLSDDGGFRAGICRTVVHLAGGGYRLFESWTWTEGAAGAGTSVLEEAREADAVGAWAAREEPAVITWANAEGYPWGNGCEGRHLVKQRELSVIQERMPPGAAEARHYHRSARQFFFVLSGALTIEAGSTPARILGRHEGVELRPGTAHKVSNLSNEVVDFVVVSQPPSHGDRVLQD